MLLYKEDNYVIPLLDSEALNTKGCIYENIFLNYFDGYFIFAECASRNYSIRIPYRGANRSQSNFYFFGNLYLNSKRADQDSSLARCELKFNAKNFNRVIVNGDTFLLDSKSAKSYTLDLNRNSRVELEHQFAQLTGGGLQLPKEIVTFKQFKRYIEDNLSGGSVKIIDRFSALRLSLVSKNTLNTYLIECTSETKKLTFDDVVNIISTGEILMPSTQF